MTDQQNDGDLFEDLMDRVTKVVDDDTRSHVRSKHDTGQAILEHPLYRKNDEGGYGQRVLYSIAQALNESGRRGWGRTELYYCVQFRQYITANFAGELERFSTRVENLGWWGIKKKILDGTNGDGVWRFLPKTFNIWNFAGLNSLFGLKHPGNIPGDIILNLLWYFTEPEDMVIDPFAGGGVTPDAIAWWNSQPDYWPLSVWAGDLHPRQERHDVVAHDAVQPLPTTLQGAGLVFLDPPYWKQKQGEYAVDDEDLSNMALEDFHGALAQVFANARDVLRPGGYLALIIGPTQDRGVIYDHAFACYHDLLAMGYMPVHRIIVPYSTQQVSGADVSQAREGHYMLKLYRDLIVVRWGARPD